MWNTNFLNKTQLKIKNKIIFFLFYQFNAFLTLNWTRSGCNSWVTLHAEKKKKQMKITSYKLRFDSNLSFLV